MVYAGRMSTIQVTIGKGAAAALLAGLGIAVSVAFAVFRPTPSAVGTAEAQAPRRVRILVGTVTRISPPLLYVESDALGASREYPIAVNGLTTLFKAVPWKEGEREEVLARYRAELEKLDPKNGDAIPPPPPSMKPQPLPASELKAGDRVGVLIDAVILPDQPAVAKALRPLVGEELVTGRVSSSFPF